MADKEGWVYILTNEAMPGLVKIGWTMQDPAIRAEELSDSTAVPISCVVNCKALVLDPKQIDRAPVVGSRFICSTMLLTMELQVSSARDALQRIRAATAVKRLQ